MYDIDTILYGKERCDMTITATEFKKNLGKYLAMVKDEEIYITKNGRRVAKLSDPAGDRLEALHSLVGIAKGSGEDVTLEDIRDERLAKQ